MIGHEHRYMMAREGTEAPWQGRDEGDKGYISMRIGRWGCQGERGKSVASHFDFSLSLAHYLRLHIRQPLLLTTPLGILLT